MSFCYISGRWCAARFFQCKACAVAQKRLKNTALNPSLLLPPLLVSFPGPDEGPPERAWRLSGSPEGGAGVRQGVREKSQGLGGWHHAAPRGDVDIHNHTYAVSQNVQFRTYNLAFFLKYAHFLPSLSISSSHLVFTLFHFFYNHPKLTIYQPTY